jgi:hypothetical protein
MGRVRDEHWIDDRTVIYQTNCLYTAEGQIVVVRFLDDGHAQMWDLSRGIYGRTEEVVTKSAEAVETEYLHSRLTMDVDYPLQRELERLGLEHKHRVPCTR